MYINWWITAFPLRLSLTCLVLLAIQRRQKEPGIIGTSLPGIEFPVLNPIHRLFKRNHYVYAFN